MSSDDRRRAAMRTLPAKSRRARVSLGERLHGRPIGETITALAATLARTERQCLVLVLAYARPLDADDLAAAVSALEPSALYERIQRLRHRNAAYRLLYDLAQRGLLERAKRGRAAVFRLRRAVRSRVGAALDRVQSA